MMALSSRSALATMTAYASSEMSGVRFLLIGLTYSCSAVITSENRFFVSLCRLETAMRAARIA